MLFKYVKLKYIFFLLFVLGFQKLIAQCNNPVTITPGTTTICNGSSVTLEASGNDNSSSWEWTPSAGLSITTGNTVIASPTTTTIYSVTRICTPNNGDPVTTTTASVTVTVNPLPVSNAGSDINYCSGSTGTIGAASTSGHTYSWSPITGLSSSTSSNPTVSLTNSTSSPVNTTYTVTTTITATGCTSTDAVIVTVRPTPISNFTFNNNNQCSPVTIQFTNTSINGTNYQWNFGDPGSGFNNTSIATNPSHTYNAIGSSNQTYIVSLLVTNSFSCSNTISQNIIVNQRPDATIANFDDTPFTNCLGGSYNLVITNKSTTAASNTNYNINWGDGTSDFTSTNWAFNATTTHAYTSQGLLTKTN